MIDVRVCVLFIYTISIRTVCVSWEELTFTESNQHIWLLLVTFKKQKHCGKQIFDISELFIQCNTNNCCEHITGDVNIYLHGCASLLASECVVFVSVSVLYQTRIPGKKHIMCQTSVNLKPRCIKAHSEVLLVLRYQGSTCVDP